MSGMLGKIFGEKPRLPEWKPIDPAAEQKKGIQENLAALPEAAGYASQVNAYNQAELDKMWKTAMPNIDSIKKAAGSNIESMLKGVIPQDVQNAVQNSAAARALGGGYGGSGMGRSLVARDLGLTSLDLTQRGLTAAERWMTFTRKALMPDQFDVTDMFLTPAQRLAFVVNERDSQFQYDYLKAQIDAMPGPIARGLHDTIMSLVASYRGGTYTGGQNWGQSMASTDSFEAGSYGHGSYSYDGDVQGADQGTGE